MNIVLYGGSFDPIHKAHVEVAKLCKNNIANIDEIWFIPTYKSWIKGNATDFLDRCNMVKIAIKPYETYMKIKTFEKNMVKDNNIEYSYTSELIKYIKNNYKNDNIYFLCGLDSILDINTWHDYQYILKNIEFIICNRIYDNKNISIEKYSSYFNDLKEKYDFKYKIIDNKNIDISSTFIKNILKDDIKNNDYIAKDMLDEDVYKYIVDNNLYNNKIK